MGRLEAGLDVVQNHSGLWFRQFTDVSGVTLHVGTTDRLDRHHIGIDRQ